METARATSNRLANALPIDSSTQSSSAVSHSRQSYVERKGTRTSSGITTSGLAARSMKPSASGISTKLMRPSPMFFSQRKINGQKYSDNHHFTYYKNDKAAYVLTSLSNCLTP